MNEINGFGNNISSLMANGAMRGPFSVSTPAETPQSEQHDQVSIGENSLSNSKNFEITSSYVSSSQTEKAKPEPASITEQKTASAEIKPQSSLQISSLGTIALIEDPEITPNDNSDSPMFMNTLLTCCTEGFISTTGARLI
ncbi:MAG: hypothetical protein K6G50_11290 [bacterium]|nr:hypothetical protein [bacterium]